MNEKHYFTKKERISWMIMLSIIVFSIYVPPIFFRGTTIAKNDQFSSTEIDSIVGMIKNSKILVGKKVKHQKKQKNFKSTWQKPSKSDREANFNPSKRKILQVFDFDPNYTSEDSLKLIFQEFVAQNIIKYRSNGGNFKENKDLLKIYGLGTTRYQEILPYIQFKKLAKRAERKFKPHISHKQRMVALNETDTTQLIQLKGIGSILANRIIAFRNALGGFIHVDQLQETYGLPQETFHQIQPLLKIGKPHQKFNINILDRKALSKHPYINWKQAGVIEKYRKQHGPFTSIADIYQIRMLDSNFVARLQPYLEFQKIEHTELLTQIKSDSQ
jgi:DNA uptake protein ComE-like DNA-binding protein